jgi:hypothetical protein
VTEERGHGVRAPACHDCSAHVLQHALAGLARQTEVQLSHDLSVVQESYGRVGSPTAAVQFVPEYASHSAACRGGNKEVIKRRTNIIRRQIMAELNLSLARDQRARAGVRARSNNGRQEHGPCVRAPPLPVSLYGWPTKTGLSAVH